MDNIKPNKDILDKLKSKESTSTPFSHIAGFIKEFALIEGDKEKAFTILSYLGNKEISHLDAKLEQATSDAIFDRNLYESILSAEQDKYKQLLGMGRQIISEEFGPGVKSLLKNMNTKLGGGPINSSEFENNHKEDTTALTEEELETVRKEQQVRTIINALIMGAGHRIFDVVKPESKWATAIDGIDNGLYQKYYDMVYNNLKHMWESTPKDNQVGGRINTGLVELSIDNNEAKIDIQSDIFPVLLHEMSKGVVEYLAYGRYNELDEKLTKNILSVDSHAGEHWMMLLGPQMYKQVLFLLKEAIAQYEDKYELVGGKSQEDYIIPLLQTILHLPADNFLELIEDILRADKDGNINIAKVSTLIQGINEQYEEFLKQNDTDKEIKSIERIIKELESELDIDAPTTVFIKKSVEKIEELLIESNFDLDRKKLGRKLREFYESKSDDNLWIENALRGWLETMKDVITDFESSETKNLAYRKLKKLQAKETTRRRGVDYKIKPKFSLSKFNELHEGIEVAEIAEIRNMLSELIQKGSVQEWINHHNEYSSKNSKLASELINLDETMPDCLHSWDNGWELYELKNQQQLIYEAKEMTHCIDGQWANVKNGNIKIFSLRFEGKPRWSIGYKPESKTINQVKGYTNQKKNSILQKDEDDFEYVLNCLNYLCNSVDIKSIGDIKPQYLEEFGLIKFNELYRSNTYGLDEGENRFSNGDKLYGISKGQEVVFEPFLKDIRAHINGQLFFKGNGIDGYIMRKDGEANIISFESKSKLFGKGLDFGLHDDEILIDKGFESEHELAVYKVNENSLSLLLEGIYSSGKLGTRKRSGMIMNYTEINKNFEGFKFGENGLDENESLAYHPSGFNIVRREGDKMSKVFDGPIRSIRYGGDVFNFDIQIANYSCSLAVQNFSDSSEINNSVCLLGRNTQGEYTILLDGLKGKKVKKIGKNYLIQYEEEIYGIYQLNLESKKLEMLIGNISFLGTQSSRGLDKNQRRFKDGNGIWSILECSEKKNCTIIYKNDGEIVNPLTNVMYGGGYSNRVQVKGGWKLILRQEKTFEIIDVGGVVDTFKTMKFKSGLNRNYEWIHMQDGRKLIKDFETKPKVFSFTEKLIDIHGFGQHGLSVSDAWVQTEKGYKILRRNNDDYSLLSIDDGITDFKSVGAYGVGENEVWVKSESGRGIVDLSKDENTSKLPLEFYDVSFSETNTKDFGPLGFGGEKGFDENLAILTRKIGTENAKFHMYGIKKSLEEYEPFFISDRYATHISDLGDFGLAENQARCTLSDSLGVLTIHKDKEITLEDYDSKILDYYRGFEDDIMQNKWYIKTSEGYKLMEGKSTEKQQIKDMDILRTSPDDNNVLVRELDSIKFITTMRGKSELLGYLEYMDVVDLPYKNIVPLTPFHFLCYDNKESADILLRNGKFEAVHENINLTSINTDKYLIEYKRKEGNKGTIEFKNNQSLTINYKADGDNGEIENVLNWNTEISNA